MPWDDLDSELNELFNGDRDYHADIALVEWCRRRETYQRKRDKERLSNGYWRRYYQRPEVKARFAAYYQRPEVRARVSAYKLERREQINQIERERHRRKSLDFAYVQKRRQQRRASAARVKARLKEQSCL